MKPTLLLRSGLKLGHTGAMAALCCLTTFGCDEPTAESPDAGAIESDVSEVTDVTVVTDSTSDVETPPLTPDGEAEQDPATAPVVDVDSDLSPTPQPGSPNACGGQRPLLNAPGATCGACSDGRWICDGAESTRCRGASSPNICGGCAGLAGDPGDPCGPCGGAWTCDAATRDVVCLGSADRNACGGCEVLPASPNFGCFSGIYACDGPNAVDCFRTARNACGGELALDNTPGEPCGTCGVGQWVCDGSNATVCVDDDAGRNACGTCGTLAGVPQSPCGCGGRWACDPAVEAGVRCVDDLGFNDCGGCLPLNDQPGETCDQGVVACDGPDETLCAATDSNTCGGQQALAGSPGEPCGPCEDGRVVCTSPDSIQCLGATSPNACNGCGNLVGRPGDTCGSGRRWECRNGDLRCQTPARRNACGGASLIEILPGTACGACNEGLTLCVSREETACFGARPDAINVCGGCSTLPSGVRPGSPCGECNTGSWQCDGTDGLTCVGEQTGTLRTLYADRDADGAGSPLEQRLSCSQEFGFVTNSRDCDDANPRSFEGAVELCDGFDNDCDGLIDEGFFQYRDSDGDDFGRPGERRILCGDVTGWAPNDQDCFDNDARAFPGQTASFVEPRPDGRFDFDCNGASETQSSGIGSCVSGNAILCEIRFPIGAFVPGWVGTPPQCGAEAPWIYACELTAGVCADIVELRRMACR